MTSRRLISTTSAVALVAAALATAPASAAPVAAPQDIGKTPGTYAYWSAPSDVSSFTMPMKLQSDPGDYNAYWSTQFDFTGDAAGYMGFQTHDDGGGMFLVSIWDGIDAAPGQGAECDDFEEDGSGKTCRVQARPVEGHDYEVSAVRESDGWWKYSIVDKTADTTHELGSIRTNGDQQMTSDGFVSWTEYFDWNDPATKCEDAKYSNLLFGQPRTSAGEAEYTSSKRGEYCQDMSHVTLDEHGATQENGIGQ